MHERLRRSLSDALRFLNRIEAIAAAIGMILVAVLLLVDLLGREFFGSGVFWAPRLASYATTVGGMLAFCVVVSAGGHLRPTFADRLFPPRWDTQISFIADLVSAGLCIFFTYHAAWFVYSSAIIGTRAIALEIPVWYIELIIPYVFASAAIRYLTYAFFPALRPSERGFAE